MRKTGNMLIIKERSRNRQLAINMITAFVSSAVGVGIRFFLTPFIVNSLGREAFGFISLSADIMMYAGLASIALNSMAGRFVSVSYTSGDVNAANEYYASVFFSNLVVATVIFIISIILTACIESIVNVPRHLTSDVKILLCLIAATNATTLITNIWSVATFIKNRLELSSVRKVIGDIINATLILALFSCLEAHIWYMGIAGFVMAWYIALTNLRFAKTLTPDLKLARRNFKWRKVLDLIKSGIWNLILKLGGIVGHSIDLLLVNLFLGASPMGILAITRTVPTMINSFFATLASIFAPILTALWAKKKGEELKNEFLKSIRVLGFFATVPIAGLVVMGDAFYMLWLPTEDARLLQWLTVLGALGSIISMPLEALWNIFTITNKLKVPTISMLCLNAIIFFTWLFVMIFVDSIRGRLLILVGTRTFWCMQKSLFFLPLYGAHCLGLPMLIFYKPLIKSIICFVAICLLGYACRSLFAISTWMDFVAFGVMFFAIAILVNSLVVLRKQDRLFIKQRILRIG